MDGLRAIDPGLLATVQDAGRYGWQRFGVVVAGAMDLAAYRTANTLVGNDADAAAVELTLTGGRWEIAGQPRRVAVTGAEFAIAVDGRPVPAWCSFVLRAGESLTIGRAPDGVRGYLAVTGGIAVPPVLGSRSTHVRSGIGGLDGRALRAGDLLPLGDAGEGAELELPAEARWPRPPRLRVVLGPQDGHFGPDAIAALTGEAFPVTAEADRMGYRLAGPRLRHRGSDNIVSDGIALGSIQVPASGHLILLLADRQPTGGYPKIATIVTPDIGAVAQVAPGAILRFEAIGLEAARALRREWDAHLAGLTARMRPAQSGNPYDSARLLGLNLVGGVIAGD